MTCHARYNITESESGAPAPDSLPPALTALRRTIMADTYARYHALTGDTSPITTPITGPVTAAPPAPDIVATYGHDATRLYLLCETPPHHELRWTDTALPGYWRLLNRLYRAAQDRPYETTPLTASTAALIARDMQSHRPHNIAAHLRRFVKQNGDPRLLRALLGPFAPYLAATLHAAHNETAINWPPTR